MQLRKKCSLDTSGYVASADLKIDQIVIAVNNTGLCEFSWLTTDPPIFESDKSNLFLYAHGHAIAASCICLPN